MKNITLSIASIMVFAAIIVIPMRANACFNDCYGYSQPSYYMSQGYYNYSYGNYHNYYSPSYYYSGPGYNYNYSYSYPVYYPYNNYNYGNYNYGYQNNQGWSYPSYPRPVGQEPGSMYGQGYYGQNSQWSGQNNHYGNR